MTFGHTDLGVSGKKPSKINKTKLTVLISGAVLFLILAVFVTYAGNYSRVYPRTYINHCSVGGMSKEELDKVLPQLFENCSIPSDFSFTLNGKSVSVSADEIGLEIDFEKTKNNAMPKKTENGFMENALTYFKSIFTRTDISPFVKYDLEKLKSTLSSLTAEYETEAQDASYVVEGNKIVLKKGSVGKKVDWTAADLEIQKNIFEKSPKIVLSLAESKDRDFNADELYTELTSPAQDARYERDADGNIVVSADKPQINVDKNALKDAVASKEASVTLSAEIIPAKKTKKDLEALLFSGTMGSWTSKFSVSNVPRTQNVTLSASKIDNTVLLPGESFSYDKTVGPRTAQNGFKSAGVYINNKVENGIGGGICQTSSTLYSAVLYANLEIVSRTSHSLPVSYMPPGQDATIASGAIDFVFKNNTEYPIKISAKINGGSITCSIIGTPINGQRVVINNTKTASYEPGLEIETDSSVPKGFKKTVKGSGGYAVSSTRTVYQNNVLVKTESLTKSVYHASPTVVTVNPEDRNTSPDLLTEYGTETVIAPEDIELNGKVDAETSPGESIIEI